MPGAFGRLQSPADKTRFEGEAELYQPMLCKLDNYPKWFHNSNIPVSLPIS